MSPDATPEVSVFIQTYQHADFIREAVDGVLGQRAPFDFELVVADDCSSDGTREILLEYRARHPDRIRLLLPERNLGATALFRRSVGELRGRYVAWLDGDDFWSDEEKLALQVGALRDNPDWAACFHDATVIQADGSAPERPYVGEGDRVAFGFADLLRRNLVPSLSFMARGELVRNLPDWVWQSLWSDWLAVLAVARHGEVGYLRRAMGVYRMHEDGACAGLSHGEQLEEDVRFFGVLKRAIAPEHGPLIDAYVRERHCQLTVERLRLPFSGAVATLGLPDETPTYLNGRTVWPLASGPEGPELDWRDREGSLAADLERLRLEAAKVAPAAPHFPNRTRPPQPARECPLHLLVGGPAVEWLERRSRLGRQLHGSSTTIWHDDICAIYEVRSAADAPAPMGARAAIADIALAGETQGLAGYHIDVPVAGAVGDAHAVQIVGWAIGEDSAVEAVELATGGEAFRRLPLDLARPDLAGAFPGRPGIEDAGFRTTVSLVAAGSEISIELLAVLGDGHRVPLGSIGVERRWRRRLPGEPALVSVVIPCRGEARGLEEAIVSVLGQTHAHLDVLVVEDGAGGDSGRVADRFPGVRRIRQEVLGSGGSRAAAIRASKAERLLFLDAGERLSPRALEFGLEGEGELAERIRGA